MTWPPSSDWSQIRIALLWHQVRWKVRVFFFFFWTDRLLMETQVCWVLHWLWSLYVILANILEPGCTWLFKIPCTKSLICFAFVVLFPLFCCCFLFVCLFVCLFFVWFLFCLSYLFVYLDVLPATMFSYLQFGLNVGLVGVTYSAITLTYAVGTILTGPITDRLVRYRRSGNFHVKNNSHEKFSCC